MAPLEHVIVGGLGIALLALACLACVFALDAHGLARRGAAAAWFVAGVAFFVIGACLWRSW